jgi:hypothetical protein
MLLLLLPPQEMLLPPCAALNLRSSCWAALLLDVDKQPGLQITQCWLDLSARVIDQPAGTQQLTQQDCQ